MFQPKPPVEDPIKTINLDKIPGLDDFDEPVITTTFAATKPTMSLPGAKTGQAKPQGQEEGGLLGAMTGGLTQGLSGLTGGSSTGGVGGVAAGLTGKLGDLAGSATSAGGGLLSSGKGLFKKFGF